MKETVLVGNANVVVPYLRDDPNMAKRATAGPRVDDQRADNWGEVPAVLTGNDGNTTPCFEVVDMGDVKKIGGTSNVGEDKPRDVQQPPPCVLNALPLVARDKMINVRPATTKVLIIAVAERRDAVRTTTDRTKR